MSKFNVLGYQERSIVDDVVGEFNIKSIIDPMSMSVTNIIQDGEYEGHYLCKCCNKPVHRVDSCMEGMYEYCPDCHNKHFRHLDIVKQRDLDAVELKSFSFPNLFKRRSF